MCWRNYICKKSWLVKCYMFDSAFDWMRQLYTEEQDKCITIAMPTVSYHWLHQFSIISCLKDRCLGLSGIKYLWLRDKKKTIKRQHRNKDTLKKKENISAELHEGVRSIYKNKRDFLNWEHSKGAGGLGLPRGKTTHAGDVCQVAEHKEPSFPPSLPRCLLPTPSTHTHTSLNQTQVFLTCFPKQRKRWWMFKVCIDL